MTATAVPTPLAAELADLESVAFDVYRDIHKGIRAELFAVTIDAGNVDPASEAGVEAVARRWGGAVELLISHAEHEDTHVQQIIEAHMPDVAVQIAYEHPRLERQMASLEVIADRAVNAVGDARRTAVHRLYLGLASFTSDYLAHQAVEEFDVMVGLAGVMGVPELIALNQAIVADIPPEKMATGLGVMLPAMNVDDRSELLGGMQAGAPAEVFAGVVGLTRSVLADSDFAAVAQRLSLS